MMMPATCNASLSPSKAPLAAASSALTVPISTSTTMRPRVSGCSTSGCMILAITIEAGAAITDAVTRCPALTPILT